MNKKSVLSIILQVCLAFAIVLADQLTKAYIINNIEVGSRFGELPYVADFVYVQNTGAAFSILSDNTVILSAISVVFLLGIIVYKLWKRPQGFCLNLALVLLFAGALGNGIDRIAYKYVVDFISLKWFNFPVFNIADIAIVSGAVLMAVYFVFFDKEKENG